MFVCLFPFGWRCCPSGLKDGPPVQSATIHVKSHCPYKIVSNHWLNAMYRIVSFREISVSLQPYTHVQVANSCCLLQLCLWVIHCFFSCLPSEDNETKPKHFVLKSLKNLSFQRSVYCSSIHSAHSFCGGATLLVPTATH